MSNFENTVFDIKNYLNLNNIKYENLILFGSRARSAFDTTSDYDICLLLKEELNFNQKSNLSSEIFRYLFKNNTLLPIDLIIKNSDEFVRESIVSGYLSNQISKEGIII
jgi:predicted nucleotidyltransferase